MSRLRDSGNNTLNNMEQNETNMVTNKGIAINGKFKTNLGKINQLK